MPIIIESDILKNALYEDIDRDLEQAACLFLMSLMSGTIQSMVIPLKRDGHELNPTDVQPEI